MCVYSVSTERACELIENCWSFIEFSGHSLEIALNHFMSVDNWLYFVLLLCYETLS